MKIWHSAGRYQAGRGSAGGWIVAIARNTAIDRLRSRQGANPRSSPTWSTSPTPARRRRRARRRPTTGAGSTRCLGQLPPDRALAVRAAYVEGHSYDELARHFDGAAQYHADLAAAGADRAQEVPRVMSDAPIIPDDLPDDPDAVLAAEFVLRLLDPAEEAACAARVDRDPASRRRWRAGRRSSRGSTPPSRRSRRRRGCGRGSRSGCSAGRRRSLARLWGSAGLWRAVPRRRRWRSRSARPTGAGAGGAGAGRHGVADGRRGAARGAGRPRGRADPLHPARRRAAPPAARSSSGCCRRGRRCRNRSGSSRPRRGSRCRSRRPTPPRSVRARRSSSATRSRAGRRRASRAAAGGGRGGSASSDARRGGHASASQPHSALASAAAATYPRAARAGP